MLTGKINSKTITSIGISIGVLVTIVLLNTGKVESIIEELDLYQAITRIEDLDSSKGKGFANQRMGLSETFETIKNNTRWPFGFGLGMTSAFLPQFVSRRKELVDIPDYEFWNGDNLLIWGFLEMGIGAIFYFFTLIGSCVYLFIGFMRLRGIDKPKARIVGTAFVSSSIILLGNFGAVGIPFNPDSFYFWFWVSLGLYQISDNSLAETEQNTRTQEASPGLIPDDQLQQQEPLT